MDAEVATASMMQQSEGKKRKLDSVKFGSSKIKKKEKEKKILTAEEREQRQKSLYRVPTAEELSELRENENLFKNNLFRMQIQYLLEEVCLVDKKEKRINDILHSLNSFIKELPGQDAKYDITDDSCQPENINFPLPSYIQKDRVKCKFQFLPPTEVKIIGSFLLKTLVKSDACIDVAVEIPNTCLQPRDVINFRYHFKRACYLSWIASSLIEWEFAESVKFVRGDNPYMPILLIKLKGKAGKKYSIRILTTISDDSFKSSQLSPLRNNIRANWFNNIQSTDNKDKVEFPTPYYNSSILSDMLHESNLHAIYNALNECPGMKEAICLFKVWARQRSFKGIPYFNGFLSAMLVVYLLSIRKVTAHMSSYQIFRIMLHFIASSDWCNNGITLCKADDQDEDTLASFHASFDVVFVDPSGHLNLCANIDKVTYEMIKFQAKVSLDILDNSTTNGFDGLFIKCHDFMQSVDQSFSLKRIDGFGKYCSTEEQQKVIDHGGNWSALIPRIITPLLQKGLDNRIHRLLWKPIEYTEWDVTSPSPVVHENTFWFGLHPNREFSNNIVIMGPPADQVEAKEFRSFWGEKSELRRFQDGSINEACIWPCGNNEDKMLLSERIIKYLLSHHCGIAESSVKYHASEFNCVLKPKFIENPDSKSKYVPGCGTEESLHFLKSFDQLSKQVRLLEDLPLRIKSVDGVDPSFRLTQPEWEFQFNNKNILSNKSLLLPKTTKKLRPSLIHRAIIQFETCGKWPDDIKAIHHIKAAFHKKLAECIKIQLNIPAIASPSFVDVIQNGYVFRLVVVHYREMVLYKESEVNGVLKKEYEERGMYLDCLIVKKPLHTSLIHSLNGQFHAFALTAKLAKRWVAAQMLSYYLSEEAIELIVAFLFISPVGTEAPNAHMCGFLRFLDLLVKFDWKHEPLIINLNNEITTEENLSIREDFNTNRVKHPAMFISTPYSKETSIWTKNNPSPNILTRLSLLAEAALKHLNEKPDDLSDDVVKQIFRPSFDYNVIIELNKSYIPLNYLAIDASKSIKSNSIKDSLSSNSLPVCDFNPPQIYLDELRGAFSDVALFFYDKYGGNKIGVVWKQPSLAPQSFKILNAQYKIIEKIKKKKKKSKEDDIKEKGKKGLSVIPNIKAIISDFDIMGSGLVCGIEEK